MIEVKQAILKYNLADDLPVRYGHKLRGFFANRFSEVLFHNHKKDGDYRYGYPLIQYKIINGKPTIIGLEDGAELIIKNFLDIDKLVLGGKEYLEPEGRLNVNDLELRVENDLEMPKYKYNFITPWLGLNQKNYRKYENEIKNSNEQKVREFFSRILIGNILSFAKGVDWWVESEITIVPKFKTVDVKFKNKDMLGFVGEFYANINLPEYIGLGQSTARGFGTIKQEVLI